MKVLLPLLLMTSSSFASTQDLYPKGSPDQFIAVKYGNADQTGGLDFFVCRTSGACDESFLSFTESERNAILEKFSDEKSFWSWRYLYAGVAGTFSVAVSLIIASPIPAAVVLLFFTYPVLIKGKAELDAENAPIDQKIQALTPGVRMEVDGNLDQWVSVIHELKQEKQK